MNSPATQESPANRNGHPLIFVVDDDPGLLELTAMVLKSEGYHLQTFCNPHLALEALQEHHRSRIRPDLLLTDYDMGSMTGIELISKSRKLFPQMQAIIISGTVEPNAILNDPVKVTAFITKPYKPKELLSQVQSILADTST